MKKIESVSALLDYCKKVEETEPDFVAARLMCEVYTDCLEASRLVDLDPFDPNYMRLAQQLYRTLANVDDYNPWINERTPYIDLSRTVSSPMPYAYGDSTTVGDFMLSWGWILRTLDVRAGAKVLEYGAGEAQLSIALARMGCDVSIVDIEERYLQAVKTQCAALGINIHTQRGQFGDSVPEKQQFDRILFYEAFHHALDHAEVLAKVRPLLAPEGFVLLAGEPVVELGNPAVPFPWGPRLDGISVRSSRRFGWCELGFQRPYLIERAMRSGFSVQYAPCALTGRGDCYILRPFNGVLNMGDPLEIAVNGSDAGWSLPEGTHRWTTFRAIVPVPDGVDHAVLHLANHLPIHRTVTVRSGSNEVKCELNSSERTSLRIKVESRLEIETNKTKSTVDPRELGIAVETIMFE